MCTLNSYYKGKIMHNHKLGYLIVSFYEITALELFGLIWFACISVCLQMWPLKDMFIIWFTREGKTTQTLWACK